MGPQPVRRPREPRGDRLPAADERAGLRRRGPARPRWPRNRPPGRWCRGRPTSAGSASASSGTWAGCTTRCATCRSDPIHRKLPSQRADLRAALRLPRELHPAALARRGGARQGLADRQDAGRPLAALRQSARLLRLHVDASRQEAAVHGRRVRAGARVEPRRRPRLAPARRSAASRRAAAWCATSTGSTARLPALHELDCEPDGLRVDRRRRRRRRASLAYLRRGRDPHELAVVVCNFTPVPRHDYRIGVPRAGPLPRALQHRRPSSMAAAASAMPAASRPRRIPLHGQAYSLRADTCRRSPRSIFTHEPGTG